MDDFDEYDNRREDFIDPIRAEVDQRREIVKAYAPLFGTYFKALLDEGFTRDEALALTGEYQWALLTNAGQDGDD